MAADPSIDPSDLWKWLVGGFGTVLATLVGVIWKMNEDKHAETDLALAALTARISKNEGILSNMVTRDDLDAALPDPLKLVRHSDYEQNRQEVRADMIKIHEKLDRLTSDVHTSHSTIMIALAGIKNGNGK